MPTPQSQSNSLVVSVGVQCNVGKERPENQDRITRAATPFGDLFVVADGVGGQQGGSEAAQTVVDGFAKYLNANGNLTLPEALQQAVRAISADLQQRAAANPALRGMGSTVVLCVINGNQATYAHAGDSRAYLVRDRQLKQLTRDHSVMERLVSGGVLTPAQAREHPDASVLTRAIGQAPDTTLDIAEIALQPNDALLLCSDGLWAYAKHEEMEAVATSASLSASGVASALLNLALEGGGGDNVSIQFLRFQALASGTTAKSLLGMPQKKALPVLGLATVLVIAAAGLFAWNQQHPLTLSDSDDVSVPVKPARPEHNPIPATPKPPEHPADTPAAPPPRNSAPPTKTKVVIIQEKDGSVVDWSDDLDGLSYLQTSRKTGSDACLALEKSTDVLYYSHPKAGIAKQIQNEISPSPIAQEMTQESLNKCGVGDLFAVPAKPFQVGSVKNKVETGVQAGVDKTRTGFDAAKKKAEEELEKAKEKLPK